MRVGKNKINTVTKYIVLPLFLILTVSVLIFLYARNNRQAMPTDDAILSIFNKHQDELQQIVEMLHYDENIIRVSEESILLSNQQLITEVTNSGTISKDRWREYKDILRKVGASNVGYDFSSKKIIWLTLFASGLVTGGEEKGLAFAPTVQLPVVESLDSISIVENINNGLITKLEATYKSIGGNWYIYYWFDD